jgi:hypothetical protein
MPSVIVEFPFDSGANEAVDASQLPAGMLATVENARLDRDGRLSVRPGNTALGTTTYSGNSVTCYDLANYNSRLCALGDQTGQGRPTDLFEYVNEAAVWRASAESDASAATGPRIPRATAARETGRIPDVDSDVQYVSTATDGSAVVCAVYQLSNSTCRVHAYIAATDQTLMIATRTLSLAKVIFDGTHFWIVGQNSASGDVVGFKYTPSVDKSLTATITTLVAAPGTLVDLAAAKTGVSDFTIAYIPPAQTSVLARRFDNTGAQQASFTVVSAITNAFACAVAGDNAGNRLAFAYGSGSPQVYNLITCTPAHGSVVGPTSLFSGNSANGPFRLGLACDGVSRYCACAVIDSSPTHDLATQLCTNASTNTLLTFVRYRDAYLAAGPVAITTGGQINFYFGAVDALVNSVGEGTNQLVEQGTNLVQTFKDAQLVSAIVTTNLVGQIGLLGTKLYWGNVRRGILETNPNTLVPSGSSGTVTELEMNDTGRRQMSQIANQLHIAGALPLVYDGVSVAEQGFAEQPFVSLAQTTGGGLTALGVYNVQTVWEIVDSRGNVLRSQPGQPQTITLGGSNATITATSTMPHSLRNFPALSSQAGYSVRCGFYRTEAGQGTFHIDKYAVATANYAEPVTVNLTQSDVALRDNAVLYTQEQTSIPHVAPQSYRYSWPTRERLVTGGLPNAEEVVHSKLLFPREPVEYAPAGQLGFTSRVGQDVTAVAALETFSLVWTKQELRMISGRGPEQDGTGDFDSPQQVPAIGGCQDWRSVLVAPPGVFFQMQDEKLMLLTRSGYGGPGEVQWIGQPLRDTLTAYPVITGAIHVRSQMIVVFALQNVAGNDGRLAVYDLRRNVWYVDTVGPVSAVSELAGRLAFIQGGVVFLQDAAPGNGAYPTITIKTGVFPVEKRLGWGHVYNMGLLGKDVAPCTIEAFIDYDDGVGFQSLGQEALTGAGNNFELFWSCSQQKTPRMALKWVITGASNTLGCQLKSWALEVEKAPNFSRAGSASQVA